MFNRKHTCKLIRQLVQLDILKTATETYAAVHLKVHPNAESESKTKAKTESKTKAKTEAKPKAKLKTKPKARLKTRLKTALGA